MARAILSLPRPPPYECEALPDPIDANCEQPALRSGFRHTLPDWAEDNRVRLLSACLTLVRAWVRAGMPKVQPPERMGSFDAWAETMGGILSVAGVPDFLRNWPDTASEVNSTEGEWLEFVHEWQGKFAEDWVTSQELYDEVVCASGLYGSWATPRLLLGLFGRHPSNGSHTLGLALGKRKGTVLGGFKAEQLKPSGSHDKKTRWRLHQTGT